MKVSNMKNTIIAAVLMAFAALAANAQEYETTGTRGKYTVARGYISASTTVRDVTINDNASYVWVGYRCGTAVSMTLLYKLADGTVVDSSSKACDTTQRWVSTTAPLAFERIAVSATTSVSTTAGGASATIIETKE